MKCLQVGIFLCIFVATINASKDIGQVMDSIFQNYDKRIRPKANDQRLRVDIEVALLDVYNFDELNHQVTLSMYLRQKWMDPRLKFNPDEVNGTKVFIVDTEQAKKMWFPDTFLANERNVVKHELITPNEFTRIHSDGNVARSVKITVTIGCMLKLRWFPFDQNTCTLDFESYGYTLEDLEYAWGVDKDMKKAIHITQEATQGVRFELTSYRGYEISTNLTSGAYSRAVLGLSFKRLSFRYLLDVYFPATAIPAIAFITLVVGPLHFRVLMSTICMAMMIVYAAILMLLTPKVDYKTALDFYVFNSSVTVFNVVLVNFLIYYLLKPKPTPRQIRMHQMNGSSEDGKGILVDEECADDQGQGPSSSGGPTFPNKGCEILYKLCEKSYLTMPLFFLAFNLIYWTVVLIASSGAPADFIPVESRE